MTTDEWIALDERLYRAHHWRIFAFEERVHFGVEMAHGPGVFLGGIVTRDLELDLIGPIDAQLPHEWLRLELRPLGYVLQELGSPLLARVGGTAPWSQQDRVGLHGWQRVTVEARGFHRPVPTEVARP